MVNFAPDCRNQDRVQANSGGEHAAGRVATGLLQTMASLLPMIAGALSAAC